MLKTTSKADEIILLCKKNEKKVIIIPKACPKCGSENIKEVEDKSRVLSYAGHIPVYATVNVCRECSHRFDE